MNRPFRTLRTLALPLVLFLTQVPPAWEAAQAATTPTQYGHARIHIPSMTCSNHSCATTVYLSLIRLPGVMGVNIDEAKQDVTVKYIPSRNQPANFLKAVRNAGYPGTLVVSKER